jgi:hypothetical protein
MYLFINQRLARCGLGEVISRNYKHSAKPLEYKINNSRKEAITHISVMEPSTKPSDRTWP